MNVNKLERDSAFTGRLPKGCGYCAFGAKMVLLVTGSCVGTCWYCPLSEEKKGNAVVYADELLTTCEDDILDEARSIGALGTGITGGDPLVSDDTFDHIGLLKGVFGEDHHIHLYTQVTDIDRIRRACQMGLDEIRFHPPVETWNKIEGTEYPRVMEELRSYPVDVGIEIPSIPFLRDETLHLLKVLGPLVDFVNLNELEFSSTNFEELLSRGLREKSDTSSAVMGSQKFALELMCVDLGTSLHYCSASFKDGVQMRNRISRRAQRVAREWEIITDDGTLVKGIIVCNDGEEVLRTLLQEYEVPVDMAWFDPRKGRVEVYLPILEELAPLLEEECYGIEVYPTADALEVERWPL